jgi:hypothetical protein
MELCLHPRRFSAQEIEILVLQLWHLFLINDLINV